LIHFRLEFQFQKLHTNNDIKYKNFNYKHGENKLTFNEMMMRSASC
jgi:hypothetical protein